MCVLVGRPADPDWDDKVVQPANEAFEEVLREGNRTKAWSKKQTKSRRGPHIAETAGVSYGGGQDVSFMSFRFGYDEILTGMVGA